MSEKRIINPFAICIYRGSNRKTTEHLPPPIARMAGFSKPEPEDLGPVVSSPISDVLCVRDKNLLFRKGKISFDVACFYPLKFILLTYDSRGTVPYVGDDAVFLPDSFALKHSSASLIVHLSIALLKAEFDVYGGKGRASISRITDFMLWPGVFPPLNYARSYLIANSNSPIARDGVFDFVLSTDPDSKRREAYSSFKDEFFEKCPTAGFSN